MTRLQLMLHAEDGCVPYMTPALLQEHFPPTEKHLLIGMAVRDVCVAPTYESKPSKKQKKKIEKQPSSDAAAAAPKMRGYTFTSVKPDPWLMPYARVAVPSFNLVNDIKAAELTSKENSEQSFSKGKAPKKKARKSPDLDVKASLPDVSSTNQQVLVWTPHGRQILTPEMYATSSFGLEPEFTVSLYDMSAEAGKKRQEKAQNRTKEWLLHHIEAKSKRRIEHKPNEKIWAPVIIHPNQEETIRLDAIQAHAKDIDGVALVGSWHVKLADQLRSLEVPRVACLSTDSTLQFIDAACSDIVNVIGTDLPSKWVKQKKAFGMIFGEQLERDDDAPKLNADGCFDMDDVIFAKDRRTLLPGCTCLACDGNQFTRAYIHHLVRAQEMAACILLMGHNLRCMLQLTKHLSAVDDLVEAKHKLLTDNGLA